MTGCEDWKIRLWEIPEGGLTETIKEPYKILLGNCIITFW